ncbi:hypothetical protein NKG94_19895 [Micromonospora sp. M12]
MRDRGRFDRHPRHPGQHGGGRVPARPLRTTDEYLKQLQAKSLGIGHLAVPAKHEAIKRIYGVTTV